MEQKLTETTHDFGDGMGPVPAHRHDNDDGTTGGWVAETTTVAPTAYVGPDAQVYGHTRIYGHACIGGYAWIGGYVRIVVDDAHRR